MGGQIARNAAAATLGRLRREGGGIGGDPALAAEALERLARVLQALGVEVRGARVVELGPGRSPELSASFLLAGAAEATLVDTDLRVPDDARTPSRYAALAREVGAQAPTFRAIADFDALVSATGGSGDLPLTAHRYRGARLPVASGTADVIISKSVLEHVARRSVPRLLREHARVLSAGGVAAHLIDLRDHLHVSGDHHVEGDWLEALRWPEPLFRLMFSRRSTSINRLRASEWRRLFDRAGLRVAYWNVERLPLPPGFDRSRLRPRWRDLDDDELATAWVEVGLVRG